MSELPKGWASSPIKDLFDFKYGKGLPQDQRNVSGNTCVYGSNGVVGHHDASVTKGPTIIVGRKGSVGEVHLSLQPCWPIDTTYFIDEFFGEIPPGYWAYFLKSLRLGQQEKSSAIPGISRDDIYKNVLLVPPVAEQRRIVAKLEALLGKVDDCRKRLNKIPVLLKRFRQSVLAAACSGRLTSDWRDSDRKPTTPVSIGIPDENLPEIWRSCCINDIGKVSNGSTPSRKRSEYWNGNIHWVSSGEVKNNIICETRESISNEGYDNSSVKLLPPGTVLLAMIGEGKTRGQTAILRIEATINQNVAAIVLDAELISSEYLWYWFRGQYEITRQSGSGSGPQALNCQRVRELPLNLPPLPEQHEIVRRVEALFAVVNQIEARYAIAKGFVDRLTQSILAKAFRGELVPQDPNDEPASVQLERIRVQRATPVSASVKRKPHAGYAAPASLAQGSSPTRRGRPPKAVPPVPDLSAPRGEHEGIPLSKPARKILKCMKPGRDYARADLADVLGLSIGGWNIGINELKGAGLVVQYGVRRGTKYRMQCM